MTLKQGSIASISHGYIFMQSCSHGALVACKTVFLSNCSINKLKTTYTNLFFYTKNL